MLLTAILACLVISDHTWSFVAPPAPAATPTEHDADETQPVPSGSASSREAGDPRKQPSPDAVADEAMRLLSLRPSELLAEIGCGNAQHLIRAVQQYGCRGLGVEIDKRLAQQARASVEAAGLSDKIVIIHGDAREVDYSNVDAVYLYHFPDDLEWIAPKVAGKRVASAFHPLPNRIGKKIADIWLYGTQTVLPAGWRVDFWTADWCSVCREMKPQIVQVLQSQVTMRDPANPKLTRWVTEHRITALPVLQIVDDDNRIRATIRGRVTPSYLVQRANELAGVSAAQRSVRRIASRAVWQGRAYSAPVCSSPNCGMCNSIRMQLQAFEGR